MTPGNRSTTSLCASPLLSKNMNRGKIRKPEPTTKIFLRNLKITLEQHRRLVGKLIKQNQEAWIALGEAGQTIDLDDMALSTARWIDASNEKGLALLDAWKRWGHT